jgi:hypothetical protein
MYMMIKLCRVNIRRDGNALQIRIMQMLLFGMMLYLFLGDLDLDQRSIQNRSGFLYQTSSPTVFIGMLNAMSLCISYSHPNAVLLIHPLTLRSLFMNSSHIA